MLASGLARAAGHSCSSLIHASTGSAAAVARQNVGGIASGSLVLTRGMAKQAQQTSKKTSQSFKGNKKDKRKPKPIRGVSMYTALPVNQLPHPVFESENRTSLQLPPFNASPGAVGQAMEFSLPEHDPVRIFGLPKKLLLEFRVLSKPCSVVREITVETAQRMDHAKNGSSKDTRLVLTGRAGCGKSFLLLQTVEHCVQNGWIVLYIPRAVAMVNSTTKHEYNLRTRTYDQPDFIYQTLQRFQTVNKKLLGELQTAKKHVFEKREVQVGTTLSELVGVALKEPALAAGIWEALLQELDGQTKFPVLMAVDDLQALYCTSKYRDPHFAPIRPYHLTMPRSILEYASGKRSFAKGAFLGSITASETLYRTPVELAEALSLTPSSSSSPSTYVSPLAKRSKNLMQYTTGLQALEVPEKLTVDEAASLFEVWMKDKAVVPKVADEVFLAKYTESSGNARDFVWRGLVSSLEL